MAAERVFQLLSLLGMRGNCMGGVASERTAA